MNKRFLLGVFVLLFVFSLNACFNDEEINGDLCPDDPDKMEPGVCGCGTPDELDPEKGIFLCLLENPDLDLCPNDELKSAPGICGCGVPDHDSDGDTLVDCRDDCPNDAQKVDVGICGCGVADVLDPKTSIYVCLLENPDLDLCPEDAEKLKPGTCGCGTPDVDSDGDTVADCLDKCPNDAQKTEPGLCGCGLAEENTQDSDGDTVADCADACPSNPLKWEHDSCKCELIFDAELQTCVSPITSKEELVKLAHMHMETASVAIDVPYKVLNDINLCAELGVDEVEMKWQAIGTPENPFRGTFNGGGHKIFCEIDGRSPLILGENLEKGTPTVNGVGLFGQAINSSFENIYLEFKLQGEIAVGALLGAGETVQIKDVHFSGSISGMANVGGLSGVLDNSNLERVSFQGAAMAKDKNLGGLIGIANKITLSNASAMGELTGLVHVGGIVGELSSSSMKDIDTKEEKLVMRGTSNIGGFIGVSNDNSLENLRGEFVLSASEDIVGGIVAYMTNGTITNAQSKVTIEAAKQTVGGIVGAAENIKASNLRSQVSIELPETNTLGGICGVSQKSIWQDLFANVRITSAGIVGGLFGLFIDSALYNSVAVGLVHGSKSGGLIGSVEGASLKLSNTYPLVIMKSDDDALACVIGSSTIELKELPFAAKDFCGAKFNVLGQAVDANIVHPLIIDGEKVILESGENLDEILNKVCVDNICRIDDLEVFPWALEEVEIEGLRYVTAIQKIVSRK